MKKIYIAGCGGMLGEAFEKVFSKNYIIKCTDIDVNEDWLDFLDFRDYESYKKDVEAFNPDWLFHLGAFTDLEYCEYHQEETYRTNSESVEHAVKISNLLDIPLLYISTAGIFDGRKDLYDEGDAPNPMGHYAKSKYLGEQYVQNNSKNHLICRAGWMMGGGPKKDKKFINKIIKQINSNQNELMIVDDKLGTPTYTHDFANNVSLLIDRKEYGLFNMVCSGLTSRLEVATELVKYFNKSNELKITRVSSEYFSKDYFAERPPNERLVNARLNKLGLNIMRDWRVALKEYLADYYL
jgi:dTDP-4-dehydrorhamnose reductase